MHSVSFCLICNVERLQEKCNFHYKYYTSFQYSDLSPVDAEKKRLADLIKSIQYNSGYKITHRIAVVTDHDLQSHIDINSRQRSFYDGNSLPKNFKLVYASADGGMENPLNKAIALCDEKASEILDALLHKLCRSQK